MGTGMRGRRDMAPIEQWHAAGASPGSILGVNATAACVEIERIAAMGAA
jgi:hypothetical protein